MEKVNQIKWKTSSTNEREREWDGKKEVKVKVCVFDMWWVDVFVFFDEPTWRKSIYFLHFLLTQTKQSSPLNGYFSMIHQLKSNLRGWNAKQMCAVLFLRLLCECFCDCFDSRKNQQWKKKYRSIFTVKVLVLKFNINAYTQIDRNVLLPPKNVLFFTAALR